MPTARIRSPRKICTSLYQISTGDYLPDEDRLLPDHFYRHDVVYVVGGEESREGLPAQQPPDAMKRLVDFANAKDGINELHKAAILHLAFAYYHPFFDGNAAPRGGPPPFVFFSGGGYPAALFTPFSRYIAESKAAYYKAYDRVEKNALISGYTDVTPFLSYFCNEVYNRLQVDVIPPQADLQVYQTALANGKITEKNGCSGNMFCLPTARRSSPPSSWKKTSATLPMPRSGRL